MKTKKMYCSPIPYVIEVEEDEIMLEVSVAALNSGNNGYGVNDHHLAADWFNDNASDNINTVNRK